MRIVRMRFVLRVLEERGRQREWERGRTRSSPRVPCAPRSGSSGGVGEVRGLK
jgi:hypothetical protein